MVKKPNRGNELGNLFSFAEEYLIDPSLIPVNKGMRLGGLTKFTDLYETVCSSLNLISLCVLTRMECGKGLQGGTHQTTSCSNTLRRQVTATSHFVCTGEFFCESLCLRNRILSPQQIAQNQIRLNLYDSLRRQNSVAETKISTKLLQNARIVAATYRATCTQSDFVAATCCSDMSPSVLRP